MDIEQLAAAFPDARGFLNTASLGLPAVAGVEAIEQHLDEWRHGRCEPPDFDHDVERSRQAFARLVGVDTAAVAAIGQVSVATGLVASSIPDGARVLCAEEDFTSVLFPFLADPRLDVVVVPLDRVLDSLTADIDLVAVSAVQSADGRRIDLDALASAASDADARTFVDITQAAGWVEVHAGRFDVTACGAYKWLCCPRGAGFMTVNDSASDWIVPRHANWYAGDNPWTSIYGPPLRLSERARRYDTSPAWIAWVGSAPAVQLLAEAGPAVIGAHDVGLANELLTRLCLPPSNSAIVAVDTPNSDALAAAGIRSAGRAGKVRLSFHHYNTVDDVELVAEVLGVR
ncbi:aminotransferase class V-fold PLP-dependent enzyme [soil metagenome]